MSRIPRRRRYAAAFAAAVMPFTFAACAEDEPVEEETEIVEDEELEEEPLEE